MKIMCGNYGFKNWYGRGIRSSEHNLRSSENKAWKVQVIRDLNPWTLQYRCSALSWLSDYSLYRLISANIKQLKDKNHLRTL